MIQKGERRMALKKNDVFTGVAVDYTFDGLGVVRHEGLCFFVKDLLKGGKCGDRGDGHEEERGLWPGDPALIRESAACRAALPRCTPVRRLPAADDGG